MKAMNQEIITLSNTVKNAITATAEGRQLVVQSCKRLCQLIEKDVHDAGAEWMLEGMYNELCNGNFSEPFMAEVKKNDFEAILAIYQERILPRLEDEKVSEEVIVTYDVHFNNDEESNSKGFELSLDEAKQYIAQYNGTNESYFKDYKAGIVSVVNNETGEVVFEAQVI